MNIKELDTLQRKILNQLTDKHVAELKLENEDERFGALTAMGYAFKQVTDIIDKEIMS